MRHPFGVEGPMLTLAATLGDPRVVLRRGQL
jgi:hypothetical protein